MLSGAFFLTGTRIISAVEVRCIDLWKTDENAQFTFTEGNPILLDEGETQVLRRWAELELQGVTVATQSSLISARCDMQEETHRARKMNRAASRMQAKDRRLPAAAGKGPRLVNIDAWKSTKREEVGLAELATSSPTHAV